MDLSVVIVSYNVSSFLRQALATVEEAIGDLDVEVFVVDNASNDDSVAMVKANYPRVRLIENSENAGFAKANNQALSQVNGRYVLLLNPDTVLRKGTLSTMVSFLDDHPGTGAAGCKVINPDGSLQLACRRGFPTPGVAFYKMIGLSGLFPKSKTFGAYNLTYLDPDTLSEVDAVSGSFMMLRKEALDAVGFLDEDYFMYGEDLDLCYRIKQAGWKIFYVPDTEIIHFKGESAKTVPALKSVRDFYTAMHIFVEKHHNHGGRSLFPQWLIIAAIYVSMAGVYGLRTARRAGQPFADLLLLNISLIVGIILRFGIRLEDAPDYTGLQWLSIFVVYSALYMSTFYFIGMYHRYRNDPERALQGIFIGFLFNVFIVNFIKQYNFSRIASFYCWGFNSIFISGWRFLFQLLKARTPGAARRQAVVVGSLSDAVALSSLFKETGDDCCEIVGCVETSCDAIRGREMDGVHILGLVDELGDVLQDYSVDMVIMVGSTIPFSRVLSVGNKLGINRPEFKLVPELKRVEEVKDRKVHGVTMIDIMPGNMIGNGRSR